MKREQRRHKTRGAPPGPAARIRTDDAPARERPAPPLGVGLNREQGFAKARHLLPVRSALRGGQPHHEEVVEAAHAHEAQGRVALDGVVRRRMVEARPDVAGEFPWLAAVGLHVYHGPAHLGEAEAVHVVVQAIAPFHLISVQKSPGQQVRVEPGRRSARLPLLPLVVECPQVLPVQGAQVTGELQLAHRTGAEAAGSGLLPRRHTPRQRPGQQDRSPPPSRDHVLAVSGQRRTRLSLSHLNLIL